MASSNRITKVAIVGAGGNVGRFITEALLKRTEYSVTAITRAGSQSQLPQGLVRIDVDYSKQETLVNALKGHDALVVTLGAQASKEIDMQLIKAAGEAGVSWILPNEWGPDNTSEEVRKDVSIFQSKPVIRKAIEDLGKSSYISISTGFWYEWSLAMAPCFGFDFAKRTLTFFDDGETRISTSTWPQVGRAVASLLSLPVKPEGSNKEACLENFKNKVVYVNSFTVSQRDILASALKVTGTKEEEWSITKEPSHERYAEGIKEMQEGKRIGMAKMLYTRIFYPDGNGDFEHGKGTINNLLGLPKEDIDEATGRAIEHSKLPNWLDS